MYIAFKPSIWLSQIIAQVFLLLVVSAVQLYAETEKSSVIIVRGASLENELEQSPASVTVLTQDELQKNGSEHFQNQIKFLPNVNYAGGSSRPRFFQIRGIGELEQYEGAPNSSVAVIVDDVDVTGSSAALTLYDIEQLEVHRGPQAIRYGSSALAGAISVTSVAPSDELTGQAMLSAGNDQLLAGGSAVGTALTKNLAARIALFGNRQDGFRDNSFLNRDDTNEREEFTGRIKLQLDPTPTSKYTLTLLNTELDNGYDAFSIFNGFDTQSDQPGVDTEKLRLAALKGEVALSPSLNLTSISSYYESDNHYSFDGDWGNNPFWAPYDPYQFFSDSTRVRETLAQQFRLNHDWHLTGRPARSMIGVNFQNLNEDTNTQELSDNIVFDALQSDYQANSYAAFASVELPLADRFQLLNGLRLEQRNADFDDSNDASFSPDDTMWGGNVTLQYTANQNAMYYGTLSRGFRGGGFNSSPGLPDQRKEFSPESLLNIELGNRFTLLGGDLNGSIAGFLNFRNDQQIKLAEQDDPSDPLSFTFITDNAAEGETAGLETDLTFNATKQLSLRANGGLLRAKITAADPALANLEDRDQSHAARWQYLTEANYKFTEHVSGLIGVAGRAAFYFDDSHDQRSQPYHLLHAGLQYNASDWSLQLWGRNLADERYAIRGFYFGNEPPDFPTTQYVQLGDPRTFGVTVNYYF